MSAPSTPSPDTGPEAIRQKFAAVASATDSPAPGDGIRVPTVNLAQPISALARTVGMILHGAPMFRFGEGCVTVNEEGKITPMNPDRFPSWVESYLSFTRPAKEAPAVESIGKDLSSKILAADQFLDQIRELKAVSEVRVPVWCKDGDSQKVELAEEGFHEQSGLYVVNRIPYDETLSTEDAMAFLWGALKDFPWELEGASNIPRCRSFSAQIAAMLGTYCHALFSEGTLKPMVVYLANQPGSGKSLLMRMALGPVHGPPSDHGMPVDEKAMETLLDMTANARKPYLVLDDVRTLHSQALNRWITAPRHAWRVMYSQREASISKVTQTFATGNGLTVSPDLERRSLVIDLFCASEAAARTFAQEITLTWLFSDETRSKFLASMWALVRYWIDRGMPMLKEYRRGSFEDYSALVGGIVTSHDFANPFQPRNADNGGGDESSRALKVVLGQIVGEAEEAIPPVLTTYEILEHAENTGMLELIVGFAKDSKKSLGHKLKALKGRHLMDSRNRVFEFGRRDIAAGAKYPVSFLHKSNRK